MARTNTKIQVLAILKRVGSRGATTSELIHDTFNPACARRVWDLQQEGHRIEKINEGGGVYRWKYLGPPLPPQQLTLRDIGIVSTSHAVTDIDG